MAKIDDTLNDIANCYQDPYIGFNTIMLEDQYMEQVKVRRKQVGLTHHKLVVLSVGEMGQQPAAHFYGHTLTDCIKKALAWRQMPTKNKRGPRKDQPQPQAQG